MKRYQYNKERVFKFNDLISNKSFLGIRVEGDKVSINEKIKALNQELELDKLTTTILDVHQSIPFWKKSK